MSAQVVQVEPQLWPSGYGDVAAVLDISLDRLADQCSLDLGPASVRPSYWFPAP
jgi:hypothetical protein